MGIVFVSVYYNCSDQTVVPFGITFISY